MSCHMDSIIIPWNPHGIVEMIPYGIHMDIPSFHVEFDHSITIPYGIQVEWRSQNEWDLSQNIFHMKWWIPCGIRGESKDLEFINENSSRWPAIFELSGTALAITSLRLE